MLNADQLPAGARLPDAAEHGGDLAAIQAAFPVAPKPWIDLSTGINPWPYPVGRILPAAWRRLPGSREQQAVRAAAARYYGVASAEQVVLAAGSQSLIQWLPRLRGRGRVAILGPTYSEHERSWALAGHDVRRLALSDESPRDADVVVVTRPNNPDGHAMPILRLTELAERLERSGGWLVVDEAFADAGEEKSVGASLRSEAVICLRSFGKFFGLAGGRLGAALVSGPFQQRLEDAIGPWAVSGPILAIAGRAFADSIWIKATRERLARAAAGLDRLAAGAGLQLIGGTSLFRLYRSPQAPALFERLAAAGIYARRFAAEATWLRLGLPVDAEARRRLARALDVPAG